MDPWLDPIIRLLRNFHRDESGDVIVLLLVVLLIWLLIAGRRVIVQ